MTLELNEEQAALLACAVEDAEKRYKGNYDQLCAHGASEAMKENARNQHRMMADIGQRLVRGGLRTSVRAR